MAMDVTDRSSVEAAVANALDQLGRIDILVNNAGIIGAGGMWERDSSSDDDWSETFEVNVRGIVRVTEAVQGHMIERGVGQNHQHRLHCGQAGQPGHSALLHVQGRGHKLDAVQRASACQPQDKR